MMHSTESEHFTPKPQPLAQKSHAELQAEALMWRARAQQNRAETRAAEAERDTWKREARKWEARAKRNRAQLATEKGAR